MFRMSYTDAWDVFYDANCKRRIRITSVKKNWFWKDSTVVSHETAKLNDITPDMVADDIDNILGRAS